MSAAKEHHGNATGNMVPESGTVLPGSDKTIRERRDGLSGRDVALAALLDAADRGAERKVDCGSCRACCHQVVVLVDEDPADYDCDPAAPAGLSVLRRHSDGACVYLGPDGCTIYDRRPAICKAFDCGLWFRTTDRAYRRHIKRVGDEQDRRLLDEGRRRALARDQLGSFRS